MYKIRTISWNIRGINNSLARRNLKEVVGTNRANLVCIQETKFEGGDPGKQHRIALDNFECTFQPSVGFSGGLATFWSPEFFKCLAIAQSRYWVWTMLSLQQDGSKIHVINVYSPLDLDAKRQLWQELKEILNCIKNEAVCLIGDFNCIRSPGDRKNYEFRKVDAMGFNAFLSDNNLLEAKITNSSFTWIGPEGKRSWIDRVFLNTEWSQDAAWQVKTLCRKHSDHKPLLLMIEDENWGPKPHKIFNYHLNDSLKEDVLELCKTNPEWENANIHRALKMIKQLQKKKASVENQKMNKDIKKLEIRRDILEDIGLISDELQEVREKLSKLYSLRDSMIRQKARITWFNLGDTNNNSSIKQFKREGSKTRSKELGGKKSGMTSQIV